MITLTKETKVKLLKAVQSGVFDGADFPELSPEIKTIQIELIDHPSQVRDYENKIDERSED